MKHVFGNTSGLKSGQIKRLENIYRRKSPPEYILTVELVRDICKISWEIRRQIGLLINRLGQIDSVIVGDTQKIVIPDLSDYRIAPGRLRSLRCVHTHMKNEPLSQDDLIDLMMLRLDLMAAVTIADSGLPERIYMGHILPGNVDPPYRIFDPLDPHRLDIGCLKIIQALETEMGRAHRALETDPRKERALLVSVTTKNRKEALDSLDELKDLADSGGIEVAGTVLQQRRKHDPRYLMGRGKLQELLISALQNFATLIVFDQELNASQIRSIADITELKVIDRTQLILDIFAQRAQTKEGKLQVELAQMKYLLPRLRTKNTAMSRLTGGIGGRGPGETKLEINRRRVRDRIGRLESALSKVIKQRGQQKQKRLKKGLPVISIIGYTNAGKSTLLNTLTKSRVLTENRLFATLDPSSRRLRFPRDVEVIITDTVGFIKNLPEDLKVAFRATLEELENADILLHIVDISNPRYMAHIESVNTILADLKIDRIPTILVLNKTDLVSTGNSKKISRLVNGIPIVAIDSSTLMPLLKKMERWTDTILGQKELTGFE